MRLPFLDGLCQQIECNDACLQECCSLISLPDWELNSEDLDRLNHALAQNTSIRHLEIGVPKRWTQMWLSWPRHLAVLSLVMESETALSAICSGLPSGLERLELQWRGETAPSRNVLQPLTVAVRDIPRLALSGLSLVGLGSNFNPMWQEASVTACELGEEDSVSWMVQAPRLQKLQVTKCRFSETTWQSLVEQPNGWRVLDLSDNQLDHGDAPYLAELLDTSPHLTTLHLADNALLGNQGMEALCETFSHKIQHLDIANCQVSQGLGDLLNTFPFLVALNLSENPIVDLALLQEATQLREVALESMPCKLNDETLAQWLDSAKSLERIDLSGNALGHESLRALGQSSCPAVILAGCSIGDDELKVLFQDNYEDYKQTTWRELNLAYNRIGNEGIQTLAQRLSRTKLSKLGLECNEFDTRGLEHLVGAGVPLSLEHFTFWNSTLSSGHPARFERLRASLNHLLQLNRAGKSLLYNDNVAGALLPELLKEAHGVYGADALYDFLKSRPDCITSTHA